MTFTKRMIAAVVTLAFLGTVIVTGLTSKEDVSKVDSNVLAAPKQTLQLWYTDEALTDYLSAAVLDFYEQTDIRVITRCVSGLEYLEQIYHASLEGKDYPDLFVISNDSLEKAFLAGAASSLKDQEGVLSNNDFPDSALNAITYRGTKIAYPFYFETSVFLYNKTYLEDMAKTVILGEQAEAAEQMDDAESSADAISVEIPQEELDQRVAQMQPKTIDDILVLADQYDAPENVEAVFKWDVSDIFYNYFFVGNSINVGGKSGDDPNEIDIYNENALESLKVYQTMNQFFSIDTAEVTYESVLQDFIDGKIVFSVVTTDAIAKLEEAKQNNKFAYEYGIAKIPDINETIKSTSLSVTNAIAVNGYSQHKAEAEQLAKYVTMDAAETLYQRAGKVPAKTGISFENERVAETLQEYQSSVPITKMIEASNFWVQLELCFTKVWNGENANEQLRSLSEQIMTQVTGKPYEEKIIEEPEIVPEESVEYIDEEASSEAPSTPSE